MMTGFISIHSSSGRPENLASILSSSGKSQFGRCHAEIMSKRYAPCSSVDRCRVSARYGAVHNLMKGNSAMRGIPAHFPLCRGAQFRISHFSHCSSRPFLHWPPGRAGCMTVRPKLFELCASPDFESTHVASWLMLRTIHRDIDEKILSNGACLDSRLALFVRLPAAQGQGRLGYSIPKAVLSGQASFPVACPDLFPALDRAAQHKLALRRLFLAPDIGAGRDRVAQFLNGDVEPGRVPVSLDATA